MQAQKDLEVFEEVLVVAQKRPQELQQVPVAVSVFSGEDLEISGVMDVFDLTAIAPSLEVRQGGSANMPRFRIRSIGTTSSNFGLESAVGLYVDGVYRARQGSMINNLVDMASIEVLKGPQGTLFGRNTLVGAVLMHTVAPRHQSLDGFAEMTVGNYDLVNFSGASSFSVVEDELAFRVSAFSSQRDGYVDDIRLGDNTMYDRDRWGIRLQALYQPTADISVRIIADHSEIDEACCAALVVHDNLRPVALPPGTVPYAGTDEVVQAMGGTVMRGGQFYDFETAQSFLPESSNEDGGLTITLDWDLDSVTVTSVTGYRSHDSRDRADSDFGDLDSIVSEAQASQDAWSQELRITGESPRLSYVAGLYYFQQDLDNLSTLSVGEDINGVFSHTFVYFADSHGQFPLPAVPSFPLPALPLFAPNSGAVNRMQQEHQAFAVFGQADYRLSESLVLTAGLRYTYEEKDLSGVFTEGTAPEYSDGVTALPIVLESLPAFAPQDPVEESLNDGKVTGTLKLTGYVDENTMLYGSLATGYKSGGTNTDRINPQLDYIFDPENSQALEVGLKADFPQYALRVNVALHYTEIDDLQLSLITPLGRELQNGGDFETWGGEVEVTWAPTPSLTLAAGYARTDGRNESFINDTCWIAARFHTNQPDPDDPSNGTNTTTCDRSGDDLAFNPDFLSLTAHQVFELTEAVNGFLLLEYSRTGDTEISSRDPFRSVPAYELLNLRLGLDLRRYETTIALWGRNILDEGYRLTGFDPVGQNGRVVATPRDPAMYGVTVRKRF